MIFCTRKETRLKKKILGLAAASVEEYISC